ncbi:MAG: hypothetical protein AB7P52_17850 [Alphaproteobacteria bacterium]
MIARLPDWPERLAEAVENARSKPFRWGGRDCALFAADCAAALTGRDPLSHVRGQYETRMGAAFTLARLGCEDVAQLADTLWPRVRLALARRGDWVISPPGAPMALGVCLGKQAAFLAPEGFAFRHTALCSAAWKVGE